MAEAIQSRAAGAIYDHGYQRYSGTRLGRNHSIGNLIRYSFRAAFGLGRGQKARLLPMVISAIVFLPALVQVGVASATSNPNLVNYAGYVQFTAFFIALFSAAQAPELVVTDKQQGVLSLYLSRPLTAGDYAMSKMFALTAALLTLTFGPQLFMLIGKVMLSATPWQLFKTEYAMIFPIFGATMMISLFVAAISLAISSLASRRAFASAGVIAAFLLLPAAAQIIRTLTTGPVRKYAPLANPIVVITGFDNWLFDVQANRRSIVSRLDLPGSAYLYLMIAVIIVGVGVLVMRYRRHSA
jgi:ABC-2 type transport system permease protein